MLDRCLAVDHTGEEVDGDQILAVLALAMRERGALRSDAVVATVMSNLGFKLAMEREGSGSSRRRWGTGTSWRR
ncbi:Phosphoglucosamine mutase [Streptomyces griseoloalbus]